MKSAVVSASDLFVNAKSNSRLLYRSALFNIVQPTALADYQFRLQGSLTNYGSVGGSLTLTRSGNGTFIGSNGLLQTAGTNVARFDFDPVSLTRRGLLLEGQATNALTYSDANGAAISSTLPTGWRNNTLQAGVSWSVVGTGSMYGIPTVDIQFTGTVVSGGSPICRFSLGSAILGTGNPVYTFSAYSALLSGVAYAHASSYFTINNTSTFQRTRKTQALQTGNQDIYYGFAWPIGTVLDTTYRLGAGMAELGTSQTSHIPTTGAAATRFADAASSMTGLPTAGVTLIEKPAGCATLSAGTLTLNTGYTIDRIMVLPGTYSADQIATIRGLM
jgi:hypothetical protein